MSGFWDDISTGEQSSSQYAEQDWPDERSEVSGFSHAFNDESTAPDDFDVSVCMSAGRGVYPSFCASLPLVL
jgi:hypothetical protein